MVSVFEPLWAQVQNVFLLIFVWKDIRGNRSSKTGRKVDPRGGPCVLYDLLIVKIVTLFRYYYDQRNRCENDGGQTGVFP